MSLYDRLMQEARERGIEHRPPATDIPKETNPERIQQLMSVSFCKRVEGAGCTALEAERTGALCLPVLL